MTAPNWQVKKIENATKSYKVYPADLPSWDDEDPDKFFQQRNDAMTDAETRNREFGMIWIPAEDNFK